MQHGPSGWETNSALMLLFLNSMIADGFPFMSRKQVIAASDDAVVARTLSALRTAENECRRCTLYKNATQAVPGEGPRRASMMLVGEQPGDKEDITGLPF